MSIVDKLVYLIRQGIITADNVAPDYHEAVKNAIAPTPPPTAEQSN